MSVHGPGRTILHQAGGDIDVVANPVDDTPRLAVIIPLDDARGNALEHLSSWTSRQTYPRERFQVVLGTDGSWPAMEARFSQLLMPHDRVVRCARGSHERTLCDAAARAASAEILLFTELHCIASPSCVEETVGTFDAQAEMAGAFITCDHRPNARLGDLEKRMLEHYEAITLAPDHWFKFHTDAFAIRRAAYLQAGGLDGRYGLFADAILAARAHDLGLTIGHAARAVVTHLTSPTFAVHQQHVADWTWGECSYWAVGDSEWSERYFGHARELANRYGLRAAVDRAAIAAVARVLVSDLCAGPRSGALRRSTSWLGELIPRLLPALLGSRTRLYAAWAATRWNEVATQWLSWNQSIRWRRYQQSAACMIRLTRLSWALAHTGPPDVVAPTPPRFTADQGGGAERFSWLLFKGLERRGVESWFRPPTSSCTRRLRRRSALRSPRRSPPGCRSWPRGLRPFPRSWSMVRRGCWFSPVIPALWLARSYASSATHCSGNAWASAPRRMRRVS